MLPGRCGKGPTTIYYQLLPRTNENPHYLIKSIC
uniref:Uncharacterized protein n=1 Tax=Arundo donax TaxID=35708 RepID=A0A0A8Y0G3_ARUDO